MDTAAIVTPSPTLRWSVALALLLVCVLLIRLLLSGSPAPITVNPPQLPQASGQGIVSGPVHADLSAVPGMTRATFVHPHMSSHRVGAHTLCLMLIALSTYASVLYQLPASLFASTAILVCLLWAWGAQQTPGLDSVALGTLLGAAVWQRRRTLRQFQYIRQVLDDLREERTVKDQAITLASQTREALQRKFSRYAQLQTIAEELSNMTDLVAIAQLAVDRAFALIGKSDVCLLFLVDQEQQALSLFASRKRESTPPILAKHGDQFDRYVLRTHAPLLVNDTRRDFRFTMAVSLERDLSSVIACPLLLGQSPAGVLRLDSAHPGAYTQDDLRLLDILLDLVETAMTTAKLFTRTQQLAMTDGLTGLMLRRPFLEQLTREISRSERSREPVSLLMLDVDHFKQYNDTFGHTAGDLVLKQLAEILRTVVPPGGVAARYGGEEFVVLLPRVSRSEACEVAEHLRRLVEQQVQGSGRRRHPSAVIQSAAGLPSAGQVSHRSVESKAIEGVTVSVGIASSPDDAQAELELIRIADQRLYQAKRAGRNRVISS